MHSRLPVILLTLGCLVCASVTTTSAATSSQGADIPACEELLTARQAAAAMNVPTAVIALRKVYGNTRYCSWFGAAGEGKLDRSVGVKWGPYADFRKVAAENGKPLTCAVSSTACATLKRSLKATSNRVSFSLFAQALDHVGTARLLPSSAFGGNPAFAWVPSEEWVAESRLGPTSWVFVLDSGELLSALCGEVDGQPDPSCAIQAAKQAFRNITS